MASSCLSRPALGDAWGVSAPPETTLGEPVTIVVTIPRCGAGPLDWVGLYPASVPSVAGVSQGRWVYLNSVESSHAGARSPGGRPRGPVSIEWPPHMNPPHAGNFEFRVHRANGYGPPLAVARVAVLPGRTHRARRAVAFAALTAAVWASQSVLNAKGVCTWVSPESTPDPIHDHAIAWTAPLNAYLHDAPAVAAFAQAVCSAALDVAVVGFLYVGAMRRSSMRPFMSLALVMAFRFVAQAAAVVPCPPGFLWPRGAVMGVEAPSLLVDYHPANDMLRTRAWAGCRAPRMTLAVRFFSGHTATVIVVAVELFEMGYFRSAMLLWLVVLPYVALLVVAFRVHRGIDVLAAAFAALAACSLAEGIAAPLDRVLMVMRLRDDEAPEAAPALGRVEGAPGRKTK